MKGNCCKREKAVPVKARDRKNENYSYKKNI